MIDAIASLGLMVPISLCLIAYWCLHMVPTRCQNCRRFTWGMPVGIRRMHFHFRSCGTDFQGCWRLPF